MSNRLFQGIIHQMRDAIGRTVGVIDETGTIISCSELGRIGEVCTFQAEEYLSKDESFCVDGKTYTPFGSALHPEYAAFVDGDDDLSKKYADVIALSLANVKQFYDEKYDRGNFIKNVVLDNILPGDIYLKARELRFTSDSTRVVLLIRIPEHNDIALFDIVQNLFPDKSKDFVININ